MNFTTKWHLHLAVVPFVALSAASLGVHAASTDPKYRLTDLGTFVDPTTCDTEDTFGTEINSKGQIIGTSCYPGGHHGFLWKDDGTPLVDLGPVNPSALNDAGQVTGWFWFESGGVEKAFLWKNDGTPRQTLSTLGGAVTEGFAIDNSGHIAGNATKGTTNTTHAVVWRSDGRIVDLGTLGGSSSEVRSENRFGQVTGFSKTSSNLTRAFIWKNDATPMRSLGALAGNRSEGRFINAKGQVAGISTVQKGGSPLHAFIWRNDGTPMMDLGTLGGADSFPSAINDSGWVVGSSTTAGDLDIHAFVWRNDDRPMLDIGGGVAYGINSLGWVVGDDSRLATLWRNDGKGTRNLNDLIDPADPLKPFVQLATAWAINDAGDIVAYGCDSRVGCRTYLVRGSSLALDPHTLAFGNQQVGTTSASESITVENRSLSAVLIASIALRGADASQFVRTSNCGQYLAAKASCTVNVTFKPTVYGAKSASLRVNGGGGGLRVVNLRGTGN